MSTARSSKSRRSAARLPMADLEAAVGQDSVARGRLFADVAALRVALAPGDEDGAGVNDLRPPAVIGIAFVEDVSGAFFQRDGAAGHDIVDLGRGHVEPHWPALPRIVDQ